MQEDWVPVSDPTHPGEDIKEKSYARCNCVALSLFLSDSIVFSPNDAELRQSDLVTPSWQKVDSQWLPNDNQWHPNNEILTTRERFVDEKKWTAENTCLFIPWNIWVTQRFVICTEWAMETCFITMEKPTHGLLILRHYASCFLLDILPLFWSYRLITKYYVSMGRCGRHRYPYFARRFWWYWWWVVSIPLTRKNPRKLTFTWCNWEKVTPHPTHTHLVMALWSNTEKTEQK